MYKLPFFGILYPVFQKLVLGIFMKQYIAIILTFFIPFVCVSHVANAKMACAMKDEKSAFDTRAMQSQLMVAALSCGEHQKYNDFIKKFRDELIASGKGLKSYFARNYSRDADFQMNKFITFLANEASKKSLDSNSEKFCAESSNLFSKLKEINSKNRLEFASSENFSRLHKINSCD